MPLIFRSPSEISGHCGECIEGTHFTEGQSKGSDQKATLFFVFRLTKREIMIGRRSQQLAATKNAEPWFA